MGRSRHDVQSMKIAGGLCIGLALFASNLGCGGGSASSGATLAVASSAVQVKMGDAPADRILSFEMTINSVVLTDQAGHTTSALGAPTTVELAHLADTNEAVSLLTLPQDTYTQVAVSVANPEVVYLNNAGVATKKELAMTQAVTVALNPPLRIGPTSAVVDLDFNLARSVSLDPVTGRVTVTPTFEVSAEEVPAAGEEERENEQNGQMDDLWGVVSSVSSASFVISTNMSSETLSVHVDSNTEFDGFAGIGQLAAGMLVKVDAVTQNDGTLLARKIEAAETHDGTEAEGLVTSVTGDPAQQFAIVLQESAGTGSSPTLIGSTTNIGISSSTNFRLPDDVDLSNLPFSAAFDPTTIKPGQQLEADAQGGLAGAPGAITLNATKVRLKRQVLQGTVSNYAGAGSGQFTFTLNLPSDSYLAILNGGTTTTVTVVQQPGTELRNVSAVTDNLAVRVRGALFFTQNGFFMVATRISPAR